MLLKRFSGAHIMSRFVVWGVSACLVATGCGGGHPGPDSARAQAASSSGGTNGAPQGQVAAPGKSADADQSVAGSNGLPPGFRGRTDDPERSLADAKYSPGAGGTWDVRTGPAHIVYVQQDTASGSYTVRTQIDQLEAPHHPEAYGVFIGGRDLEGQGQQYAYFLVRGSGQYSIKVRNGADARTLVAFTASPGVPSQDAAGRASYALAVEVGQDSARLLVNGNRVASIARSTIPASGIVGIRINHNLHVAVKPVVIVR
jgi:hypothetical protein